MDTTVDGWGPVDVAVILFEGSEFNGDVAPALEELDGSGTVRVLDLALVLRDGDQVSVVEVEDSAVSDSYAALTGEPLDLLNDVDLAEIGAGLSPGDSALVVVWENAWAARFAGAVRDSGGRVIVQERIPAATVEAAVAALRGTT